MVTVGRNGKTVVSILLVLATGGILWYVMAPPKGVDGFRERSASTAESLRSQVETAAIWAETVAKGDATHAAALVGFEEAEHDASSAISSYETYEPPDDVLPLRAKLIGLASEVTDALGALRIAGQQEDWAEVPALAEPLPRLSADLRRFEDRVKP